MTTPFVGEITLFGGNFAPRDWHFCDGTLLQVSQYTELFAVISTTYGGDGRTTFGLPDLRGRVPISFGTGTGLTPRTIGQRSGTETVTLNANQIPVHTHALKASTTAGSLTAPEGHVLSSAGRGTFFTTDNPTLAQMNAAAIVEAGNAAGVEAHENRQPYLALNYIIALVGIFPQRS